MSPHCDDEPRTPGRFVARRPDWLDLSWETDRDVGLMKQAVERRVDVPAVHAWISRDWASVQLAEARRHYWRGR